MYRTVLVPLDGSPLAERALPYARALARRTGGRVVLVRCAGAGPSPLRDLPVAQAEAFAAAEAYLQRVAGAAPAAPPLRWWPVGPASEDGGTEVGVHCGPAAEGILAEARRRRADAIVMATHGCSGLGRWAYGSVADQVLRRAEVPVLLVPAASAAAQNAWGDDDPLRVLVPLDGSLAAEAVLEALLPLAGATRVRALLLHVVEPRPPCRPAPGVPGFGVPPATDQTGEVAAARRYLETVADVLRPTGAAVAVHATVGYPEAEIAAQAHKGRVDLVAMTTHGRTGLARVVLGGVATAAVQLAGVPLLLVRPGGLRQAAAAEAPEETRLPAARSGEVLVGSGMQRAVRPEAPEAPGGSHGPRSGILPMSGVAPRPTVRRRGCSPC
jgi:nucleotide-binding universal stress UspA family protein